MHSEVTVGASVAAHASELLAALPCAVIVTDLDGVIAYLNGSACDLLRLGNRNAVGLSYLDERVLGTSFNAYEAAAPVEAVKRGGDAVYGVEQDASIGDDRVRLQIDALPLRTQLGSLAGVALVLHDRTEQRSLEAEQQWANRELVSQRLQVEELLRLSQALNVIAETVHGTLDSALVLERVIEAALSAVRADVGIIEVRTQDGVEPLVAVAMEGHSIEERVSKHREWERPDLLAGGPEASRAHVRGESYSFISAPLIVHGSAVGLLTLLYSAIVDVHGSFVDFISKVATTTALAMENARLYEQEHHIAVTLQDALIVAPGHVEGVEFAHAYESATRAAWVGGDFFDVFPMPKEHVGLVIGDVSGKGVEASTLASFARQLIRAFAQDEPHPSRVLAHVNDLVYRVSHDEEFVTIFFGVLRLGDGRLRYANGGHPFPALVSPDSVSLLEGASPIVGAFSDVDFLAHEYHLSREELLVLYTDGLIEAKRGDVLYGQPRLQTVLGRARGASLEHLPELMLADVREYGGGELRDDIAIFCCRRQNGKRSS